MKTLSKFVLLIAAVAATGCARPFEVGWTPAYTDKERGQQIARNWDWEGKQVIDDVDHVMLLRPMGQLTPVPPRPQ